MSEHKSPIFKSYYSVGALPYEFTLVKAIAAAEDLLALGASEIVIRRRIIDTNDVPQLDEPAHVEDESPV